MTSNPLILYDAKIALYFEGTWLLLDAVTELTGDTSIRLSGASRKNIFGYSPPLLQAREMSSFSVTISTYITKGFQESVFFRMAGFSSYSKTKLVLSYPEKLGQPQPEALMYIVSPQGQFCLTGCIVDRLDIPFQLDKVGQLTVNMQAKTLSIQDSNVLANIIYKKQGSHMLPAQVYSSLSGYQNSQVGQSVTFQRAYTELSQVNCFNTDIVVPAGARLTSDSNLGASIQEYLTKDRIEMPDTMFTDLLISQQDLSIRQVNGVATKRLGIQSVHSLYWDFKATETIEISGPEED